MGCGEMCIRAGPSGSGETAFPWIVQGAHGCSTSGFPLYMNYAGFPRPYVLEEKRVTEPLAQ